MATTPCVPDGGQVRGWRAVIRFGEIWDTVYAPTGDEDGLLRAIDRTLEALDDGGEIDFDIVDEAIGRARHAWKRVWEQGGSPYILMDDVSDLRVAIDPAMLRVTYQYEFCTCGEHDE